MSISCRTIFVHSFLCVFRIGKCTFLQLSLYVSLVVCFCQNGKALVMETVYSPTTFSHSLGTPFPSVIVHQRAQRTRIYSFIYIHVWKLINITTTEYVRLFVFQCNWLSQAVLTNLVKDEGGRNGMCFTCRFIYFFYWQHRTNAPKQDWQLTRAVHKTTRITAAQKSETQDANWSS